jgi:hypothetical protein
VQGKAKAADDALLIGPQLAATVGSAMVDLSQIPRALSNGLPRLEQGASYCRVDGRGSDRR